MAFQKGEVALVSYPYTDLTTVKARPAIVLSSDLYHGQQPDVVLGALTTNLAAATGLIDHVLQDWSAAGLRFPTAFKPVIFTLDPSLVVHRIGQVSSVDLSEIASRLRLAFNL